jgi:beta-glucosidase
VDPTTFLWGAATSSHQIEGGNVHNDWWEWEALGNVEGGVRSGAATDHWNRWKNDLALLKELGCNAYRFSIEWSRLEPAEGQWDLSALDVYEAMVLECERLGIVPMVTLHHFTVPQWLAAHGGFLWELAPERFASYVRKVADRLAARVPYWCTLNEPNVLTVGQYLGGFMPPARYEPLSIGLASRNLLRAHVKAYEILHANRQERRGPFRAFRRMVGPVVNLIDFKPYRAAHPVERFLVRRLRRFYNNAWLDAVVGREQHFGFPFLIPYARQVWEARRRPTADFLGVNYYTKVYVCFGPQKASASFVRSRFLPFGVLFRRDDEPANDLGWAIHPDGLRRVLKFVASYRLPIFVTENGIADDKDDRRGAFLTDHLAALEVARRRGADVRGYFHWSLLDNFEWSQGFWPRFGLYEVDYGTFERKARPSAEGYRDWIARTGPDGFLRPTPAALGAP